MADQIRATLVIQKSAVTGGHAAGAEEYVARSIKNFHSEVMLAVQEAQREADAFAPSATDREREGK